MHADITYTRLLRKILKFGTAKTDRTGTGTISLFGEQVKFDLAEGFPLLTTKRVHWKSVLHELLWFMRGETNIKYLVDNGVNIWNDWPLKHYNTQCAVMRQVPPISKTGSQTVTMEEFVEAIKSNEHFASQWGELGPVYGKQWRRWGSDYNTIDQLQNAVDLLKTTPDSRRIIVSAWNPADLEEMAKAGLPPCHMIYQFNTRPIPHEVRRHIASTKNVYPVDDQLDYFAPKYYLDLMLTQRSADAFLGVPFNIASYAVLTHIVADVVDMKPGVLTMSFGDLHVYRNHVAQVQEQVERVPRPMPRLRILRKLESIDDVKFDDFQINRYDPHPAIRAPIAV